MNEVFLPILEMAILLPTVLAIFLPVQDWLRVDKKKLFLILFPCLALYCLLGGLFCYSFKLPTNLLTIPELILGTFFYLRLLTLSPWKAASVLLAVCAVFSCLNALAVGIDAYTGAVSPLYLNPKAGIAHNLLGLAVTAIFWRPSTRQARRLLLEDEMARTWYVFWLLPSAFIFPPGGSPPSILSSRPPSSGSFCCPISCFTTLPEVTPPRSGCRTKTTFST